MRSSQRRIKAQDLFDDMYRSLADHSSRALLKRLAGLDLLLVDEMGYLNLRPEQTNISTPTAGSTRSRSAPTAS